MLVQHYKSKSWNKNLPKIVTKSKVTFGQWFVAIGVELFFPFPQVVDKGQETGLWYRQTFFAKARLAVEVLN